MERSLWIYNISRLDPSYIMEVQKFIDVAKRHAQGTKTKHICCPCTDCKNIVVSDDVRSILSHLVKRGFMKHYLIWTKHGEGSSAPYMRTTDNTTTNMINVWRVQCHMSMNVMLCKMSMKPIMLCQMSIKLIMLRLMSMKLIRLRQMPLKMQNS